MYVINVCVYYIYMSCVYFIPELIIISLPLLFHHGILYHNQVASNVILGRSHIGVHYRMDGVYGALMGETSAVRRLQQVL